MKFGVHVTIGGGLSKAPQRAADKGCDCFQMFVSNPRSWAAPKADEDEILAFKSERERLKLGSVVVHVTYLPNTASPDETLWQKSATHQKSQYELAARLGVDFFVIHPGSHKGEGLENGIERIAKAIQNTFAAIPEGPVFLLENTAGGGDTIGRNPEELAAIMSAVDQPDRMGLCLDTCHAFASGVDVAAKGGFGKFLRSHEKACGKGAVKVIHANDSMFELDHGRDRHQHIGAGYIGRDGFRDILHTRGVRSLPFILETPINDEGGDEENLATIRQLAE